jgi:hypothetical protein
VPWINASDSAVDQARSDWLESNSGLVGVREVRAHLAATGDDVYEFSVAAAAVGAAERVAEGALTSTAAAVGVSAAAVVAPGARASASTAPALAEPSAVGATAAV